MKEQETKSLSKEEKFVCEMIWGGVPVDVVWVRNSKFFQENLKGFMKWGEWVKILEVESKFKNRYENNNSNNTELRYTEEVIDKMIETDAFSDYIDN